MRNLRLLEYCLFLFPKQTNKNFKSQFYFKACSNDLLKWNMRTFDFKKNTNTDIKLNTLQSLNFLLDFVLVRKWKHFRSALTQYNFSFNHLVQPTNQDINHFHCSRLSPGLVNVDEFLILSISLFLEIYLQYLNAWTWSWDLPWLLK